MNSDIRHHIEQLGEGHVFAVVTGGSWGNGMWSKHFHGADAYDQAVASIEDGPGEGPVTLELVSVVEVDEVPSVTH